MSGVIKINVPKGWLLNNLQKHLLSLLIIRSQTGNYLTENVAKERDELVEKTGKARTTVYDNLAEMIKYGIVRREKKAGPNVRGRPIILFKLTNKAKSELLQSQ